jgi:hypothetical protein
LVVAREAVLQSDAIDGTEGSFDGSALRSMAASAVASSGSRLDSRLPDSGWQERTALLGAVLSLLFERSSSFDVESTPLLYVGAATSLATLSLETVRTTVIPASPTNAAVVARECLGLLLEKLQSAGSSGITESFVRQVVSQSYKGSTLVASFVRLVRRLDSDLNHLVLTISRLPEGSQLLLDSGLLDALAEASESYKSEESKALSSSANGIRIETPLFLDGHLELLMSLLANCDEYDRCYDVAATGRRVVANYERVLERTISEFPKSMHSLHLVTRLSLAFKHYSRGPIPLELWSKSLEQKMLSLAFDVAAHPLPREFLPAHHESGTTRSQSYGHSSVTISTQRSESWWDAVLMRSDPSLQDRRDKAVLMFSYAAEATELARNIIWVSRGHSAAIAAFDTTSVATCLRRCCDAIEVRPFHGFERHERSLRFSDLHPPFPFTFPLFQAINLSTRDRLDPWSEGPNGRPQGLKVGSLLVDLVVELLVLLLERVRGLINLNVLPQEAGDDARNAIRGALDYCRLEDFASSAARLSRSSRPSGAAGHPDSVAVLSRTLRQEIDRI